MATLESSQGGTISVAALSPVLDFLPLPNSRPVLQRSSRGETLPLPSVPDRKRVRLPTEAQLSELTPQELKAADSDGDGVVTLKEFLRFRSDLLGSVVSAVAQAAPTPIERLAQIRSRPRPRVGRVARRVGAGMRGRSVSRGVRRGAFGRRTYARRR